MSVSAHRAQRPPTLKAVAAGAGVALATASYALAGRKRGGRISPAVVARVQSVARRLGYSRNASARSLVSGRAFAIGLVVSSQTPYSHTSWGQFVEGMETELAGHGYSMVIRHAPGPAATVEVAFELMRGRMADAAVIPCRNLDGPWPAVPQGMLAPVLVPLGGAQRACPYPSVALRIPDGLREAIRALAALGHRRLLWLEPRNARPERRECVGAEAELLGLKLVVAAVDAGPQAFFDSSPGSARDVQSAVGRALPRAIRATAILCWNDRLAFHALAALTARGIRIPEDFSLVGFDDFIAAWTVPPLSTVTARTADRAAAAARIALGLAEGTPPPGQPARTIELPSRFLARGTTGPAKL